MKNLIGKDDEKIYSSAREDRIKDKYAGSKYDEFFSNHYFYASKRLRNWIDRFLSKHIGKSYNNAYSEFLTAVKESKDFPVTLDGSTPASIFRSFFDSPLPDYEVVNNVIRKVPSESRHSREKYYYVYPEGHKYRYTLCDEARNDKDFCEGIRRIFGQKFLDRIKGQLMPEECEHIKNDVLLNNYNYKDIYNEFAERHRKFSYWKHTGIFSSIDLAPRVKVENTYERRKKNIGEDIDLKRKNDRERRASRKEYAENLLHSIEQEKKEKEIEQNRVDMERLGFDDNSFKGEPYHGQKRKKK